MNDNNNNNNKDVFDIPQGLKPTKNWQGLLKLYCQTYQFQEDSNLQNSKQMTGMTYMTYVVSEVSQQWLQQVQPSGLQHCVVQRQPAIWKNHTASIFSVKE
jgi:hypothetical protein